jgi:hypothetical protein
VIRAEKWMNVSPCLRGAAALAAVVEHRRHPRRGAGAFTTTTPAQIGRARMTHLGCECSCRRGNSVRRLNVGGVVVLKTPPAVHSKCRLPRVFCDLPLRSGVASRDTAGRI